MSDEIHMQAAWRHADLTALQPWRAVAPDEALMAAEDGEEENELPRRAWLLEALMAYFFADGEPEQWKWVALRALVLFRFCLPAEIVGRSMGEVARFRTSTIQKGRSKLCVKEFVKLCEDEEWRETLRGIMRYLFPARNKWLYKGTQRVYLIGKSYQPEFVKTEDVAADGIRRKLFEMSYQDLACIFEGPLATEAAENRARSRWSARAQELIRKPIEAAGGKVHLQFGKCATARAAMSRSAAGNHNRKGKAGDPPDSLN